MASLLRRRRLPAALVPAFEGFHDVLALVERAKEEVLAAVPAPRAPGIPLGEALFAFSRTLTEAGQAMPAWRRPEVAEAWVACDGGLGRAMAEADDLRLEAPDLGFEALLAAIGDLIAPLEAFEGALERFGELRT